MVGDVVCSGEGAKVGGNANDVGGVADMVQSRKVSEKVVMPVVRSRSVGAKVKISAPIDVMVLKKGTYATV